MNIKIKKVEQYESHGSMQLDVVVEHGGKEYVESFDGIEWLEKDETGKPKFLNRVKENINNRFKKPPNKKQQRNELKEFKNKVI